MPRVLVVDDEPDLVRALATSIGKKIDCKILSAADIERGEDDPCQEPVELLVTD